MPSYAALLRDDASADDNETHSEYRERAAWKRNLATLLDRITPEMVALVRNYVENAEDLRAIEVCDILDTLIKEPTTHLPTEWYQGYEICPEPYMPPDRIILGSCAMCQRPHVFARSVAIAKTAMERDGEFLTTIRGHHRGLPIK